MKVFWLNPEKTRARLVRGLFKKQQAIVKVSEHRTTCKCPCISPWSIHYVLEWDYEATSRRCSDAINCFLHHTRERHENEEKSRIEWTPVDNTVAPLPTARLLTTGYNPAEEYLLDNIAW